MDLISFEDLVVQPCNRYFNLEEELKGNLSLLEHRLKYLEDKIDFLEIKYEELDDEILIIEDRVQRDNKTLTDMFKSIISYTGFTQSIYNTCYENCKIFKSTGESNIGQVGYPSVDIKTLDSLKYLRDYCRSKGIILKHI
jgi:hypothetical protein